MSFIQGLSYSPCDIIIYLLNDRLLNETIQELSKAQKLSEQFRNFFIPCTNFAAR